MAGYGNQADYESELLQTYLRRGRVSPISKRDVDLALSIYRMPKKHGTTLTAASAKAQAKALGNDDAAIMKWASAAVINKAKVDRAAAAKPRIVSGATMAARTGAQPTNRIVSGATLAARYAGSVPPPPSAPQPASYYSGPLTPTIAPRTTAAPVGTRKPRTSYSGSGGTRIY